MPWLVSCMLLYLLCSMAQAAKRQLRVFGASVVEMVRDACSQTIQRLEGDMTATLGRTSKLVDALRTKSMTRRAEGKGLHSTALHRHCPQFNPLHSATGSVAEQALLG